MLSIDASVIVVFLIIWILLAVLTKIFFKPLRSIMEKRDSEIGGNREAAQKATEDYEKTILEIEENLKAARAASQAEREKLEREAVKEKERIITEISEESRAKVAEAKEELDKQLVRLKKELAAKSKFLAEKIEKRILH